MINTINFNLFPNEVLRKLGQQALRIVQDTIPDHTTLIPFIEKLTAAQANFTLAFDVEAKMERVAKIRAKYGVPDEPTDSEIEIESGSNRQKIEWSNAIEKLVEVFQRHNWDAHKQGSEVETESLIDMLSELNNRCSKELAILNSTKNIDEIASMPHHYRLSKPQKPAPNMADYQPTFSTTRAVLEKAINDLFIMISALQTSSSSCKFGSCVTAINQLIADSLEAALAAENQESDETKNSGNKNLRLIF